MIKIFSEHVLILVWLALVAFLGKQLAYPKPTWVLGKEEMRYSKAFAIIVGLPLIFIAGNRSFGFADTAAYYIGFLQMPTATSDIPAFMDTMLKDKFFYFVTALFKCVISQDYRFYLFIVATIQTLCLVSVYRFFSSDFILSITLFVISTDFIIWTHNGMRQFLAVSIAFLATPLILRKKYISAVLVILFASLFHQTALMMIPLLFILIGEAWNKKTIIIIVFVIIAVMFAGRFTNLLDSALSDTQYKNVVTDIEKYGDDGTNPLRVAVYSVPAIIAFFGRKKIIACDNKLIHYCTNASIITAGMYLLSMFISGSYVGRLPIYVSLCNYILLPWEIENIIPQKSQQIFKVLTIIAYLAFYYAILHFNYSII